MEWLKKNYDKALLFAVSLVAVVFSVLFMLGSLSFANKFTDVEVEPKQEMEDSGLSEVEAVAAKLDAANAWERLELSGYRVPLFVSVPILERQDGSIVQMLDPEGVVLRTAPHPREDGEVEVPNAWLEQYELGYTSSGVLSNDPDNDGFSNLEEYVAGTSPRDDEEHPEYVTQLFLKERGQDDYVLKFSAAIDPQFQIARNEPEPRRSWFKAIGQTFPDQGEDAGRFEVVSYNRIVDPNTGKDVSELQIRDTVRTDDNPFTLVRSVETNRPIYWANFDYRHKDVMPEPFRVDLGGTFSLPTQPEITYTLKSVDEDHAVIEFTPEGANTPKEIRVPNK